LTILRLARVAMAVILGCCGLAWLVYQADGRVDGQHWDQLIWQDDFIGPSGARPDPAKWHIVTGPRAGHLQYYTDCCSNVSLDGAGHLALTARREDHIDSGGVRRSFTSGAVKTQGLFGTQYGRLEASIKLPPGRGLWSAFWALGSDWSEVGWPESGEIDMMENLGDDPHQVYGSIHGPAPGAPDGEYAIVRRKRSPVSLADGFHIYGVSWRLGEIVFEFDRAPYATVTPASLSAGHRWVFDKPFFMRLELSVGGWAGPPDATTGFPATLLVDWVQAYR
jgi:beta-glucanase (GH16 family)